VLSQSCQVLYAASAVLIEALMPGCISPAQAARIMLTVLAGRTVDCQGSQPLRYAYHVLCRTAGLCLQSAHGRSSCMFSLILVDRHEGIGGEMHTPYMRLKRPSRRAHRAAHCPVCGLTNTRRQANPRCVLARAPGVLSRLLQWAAH